MKGICIANALLTEPANGKQKTNFANIKRKCFFPSLLAAFPPSSLSPTHWSAKGHERNENKLKMRLNAQKEIRKSLHL